MDINEVPKGGKIGKVLDVIIDTTKELPSERRLNILFPFLSAVFFCTILIFVINSIMKKSDVKENILNDKQDKFYEARRIDLTNRLRASDSTIRVKDSIIIMLTKDKIESNDKTIQTQELLKKLLRKK